MKTALWILGATLFTLTILLLFFLVVLPLIDMARTRAEERLPEQTVTARIIGKRKDTCVYKKTKRGALSPDDLHEDKGQDISRNRDGYYEDRSSYTVIETHWYLTFQIQEELRKELAVSKGEYDRFELHERVELTVRGNRRIRLEPIAKKSWKSYHSLNGRE